MLSYTCVGRLTVLFFIVLSMTTAIGRLGRRTIIWFITQNQQYQPVILTGYEWLRTERIALSIFGL